MKQRDHDRDARNLGDLMAAVAALDSAEACRRFFIDLCTPAELQSLADRWCVVELLDQGMPYRQIYQQTGVSTATVTRVARTLARGEGGYRHALERLRARPSARPDPDRVRKPDSQPGARGTAGRPGRPGSGRKART